jgi:hypothetical protein
MDFPQIIATALLWVFIQHRKHIPSGFSRATVFSDITQADVPWVIPQRWIRTAQKTRSVWFFQHQWFSRYRRNGACLGNPQLMHSYRTENTLGWGFPWENLFESNRKWRVFLISINGSSIGHNYPFPSPRPGGNRVSFFRTPNAWLPKYKKINSFSGAFFPTGTFSTYLPLFYDMPFWRKRTGRTGGQTSVWLDEGLGYIYTYNKYWNTMACEAVSIGKVTDVSEGCIKSIAPQKASGSSEALILLHKPLPWGTGISEWRAD